jgi:hypothetical protein
MYSLFSVTFLHNHDVTNIHKHNMCISVASPCVIKEIIQERLWQSDLWEYHIKMLHTYQEQMR